MKRLIASAILGAASLVLAGSTEAATPCFFINQWEGWKAPNDHTIYLGVNAREVYEVDLAGGSDLLRDPDARLISLSEGPDTVCAPVDLQLTVATLGGVREPLIAKRLRKLTPEEVAAIPKRYRPF
jgi:hypothetical protein